MLHASHCNEIWGLHDHMTNQFGSNMNAISLHLLVINTHNTGHLKFHDLLHTPTANLQVTMNPADPLGIAECHWKINFFLIHKWRFLSAFTKTNINPWTSNRPPKSCEISMFVVVFFFFNFFSKECRSVTSYCINFPEDVCDVIALFGVWFWFG